MEPSSESKKSQKILTAQKQQMIDDEQGLRSPSGQIDVLNDQINLRNDNASQIQNDSQGPYISKEVNNIGQSLENLCAQENQQSLLQSQQVMQIESEKLLSDQVNTVNPILKRMHSSGEAKDSQSIKEIEEGSRQQLIQPLQQQININAHSEVIIEQIEICSPKYQCNSALNADSGELRANQEKSDVLNLPKHIPNKNQQNQLNEQRMKQQVQQKEALDIQQQQIGQQMSVIQQKIQQKQDQQMALQQNQAQRPISYQQQLIDDNYEEILESDDSDESLPDSEKRYVDYNEDKTEEFLQKIKEKDQYIFAIERQQLNQIWRQLPIQNKLPNGKLMLPILPEESKKFSKQKPQEQKISTSLN